MIATDVPGLSEVVGAAGLLFPVGDHAALARHICRVTDWDELRRKLIEQGQARAEAYSIENTVDAYVRLYEAALNR